MILYLRDKQNNTIVDLDCYVDRGDNDKKFVELQVLVDIQYYSKFLLENLDKKDEVIGTFSGIQELRGWLWERYFMGGDNDPEKYGDVIKELRKILNAVAQEFDLIYIED